MHQYACHAALKPRAALSCTATLRLISYGSDYHAGMYPKTTPDIIELLACGRSQTNICKL
jgi:hypothetical protein